MTCVLEESASWQDGSAVLGRTWLTVAVPMHVSTGSWQVGRGLTPHHGQPGFVLMVAAGSWEKVEA